MFSRYGPASRVDHQVTKLVFVKNDILNFDSDDAFFEEIRIRRKSFASLICTNRTIPGLFLWDPWFREGKFRNSVAGQFMNRWVGVTFAIIYQYMCQLMMIIIGITFRERKTAIVELTVIYIMGSNNKLDGWHFFLEMSC